MGAESFSNHHVVISGNRADVAAFHGIDFDATEALEGVKLHDFEVLGRTIQFAASDRIPHMGLSATDGTNSNAADEFVVVKKCRLELEWSGGVAFWFGDFF